MPELRLYNTLSQQLEPLTDERVGIYVCGVTPYDTTHLGHAFTYTSFDVLIRYLRFLGREVIYVRNVTDIDDDILLRARSREMDWKELGDRECAKFLADMEHLNNVPPEVEPRATEHIPEIIRIIEGLLAKAFAYERDGHVYFEVKKDADFGCLCRLSYVAQLELANERGNFPADPLKRDPLDFVLWQAKKDHEPSWPSPWGEGRPGWHIECSAMSMKYLGESFAVHVARQHGIPRRPATHLPARRHSAIPARPPLPRALEPRPPRAGRGAHAGAQAHADAQRSQ